MEYSIDGRVGRAMSGLDVFGLSTPRRSPDGSAWLWRSLINSIEVTKMGVCSIARMLSSTRIRRKPASRKCGYLHTKSKLKL